MIFIPERCGGRGTTLRLSFDSNGRLTVVTQQQTRLPVFIHINGCYKIYLQAETSQFNFNKIQRSYMTNNGRSHTLKGLGNPPHNIKDIFLLQFVFGYSFKGEMVKME